MSDSLERLAADALACRRCPRLVRWLREVERTKRAAFSAADPVGSQTRC